MASPDRHDGLIDNLVYFPFKRRTLEPGPSVISRAAQSNEEKMAVERFGTKPIKRVRLRQESFVKGLEEYQFNRAYEHMQKGDESIEDMRYAIGRASKYLSPLSDVEFADTLSRIREGRYSNGDVLAVSNHYYLQGNIEGCITIRRFFNEERQVQNLPLPKPSAPDAVDLAIQSQG